MATTKGGLSVATNHATTNGAEEHNLENRVLRRTKSTAELRAAFAQFDLDGDQSITHDEFIRTVQGIDASFTTAEIHALLEDIDDNHDGVIDISEFARASSRLVDSLAEHVHQRRATDVVKQYDSRIICRGILTGLASIGLMIYEFSFLAKDTAEDYGESSFSGSLVVWSVALLWSIAQMIHSALHVSSTSFRSFQHEQQVKVVKYVVQILWGSGCAIMLFFFQLYMMGALVAAPCDAEAGYNTPQQCAETFKELELSLDNFERYDEYFSNSSVMRFAQAGNFTGGEDIKEYVYFSSTLSPHIESFNTLDTITKLSDIRSNTEGGFSSTVCRFLFFRYRNFKTKAPSLPMDVNVTNLYSIELNLQTRKIGEIQLTFDSPWIRLSSQGTNTDASRTYMCKDILQSNCPNEYAANNFSSLGDCENRLKQLPVTEGKDASFDGNSHFCRIVHSMIATINPAHCPHVSLAPIIDARGRLKCQRSKYTDKHAYFSASEIAMYEAQKAEWNVPTGGFQIHCDDGTQCPNSFSCEQGTCVDDQMLQEKSNAVAKEQPNIDTSIPMIKCVAMWSWEWSHIVTIFGSLYLWELVHEGFLIHGSLAMHHVNIILMWILGLGFYATRTWITPSQLKAIVDISFGQLLAAGLEQPTFVALLMHRFGVRLSAVSFGFQVAWISFAVTKLAALIWTVALLIISGGDAPKPFTVVASIAAFLVAITQVMSTLVLRNLSNRVEAKSKQLKLLKALELCTASPAIRP